jgi:hypothetical protein
MTIQGEIEMDTTTVKTKARRPSRGVRKYNRKVKQEANRTNVTGAEIKKKKRAA